MKRVVIVLICLTCMPLLSAACEVCKRQQPEMLRGITHGAGPQSGWDYAIVAVTIVIAVVSLYYCVKWMVDPGEKENAHIKRRILNAE